MTIKKGTTATNNKKLPEINNLTGNGRETSETEHQVSKNHPMEIQTEERGKEQNRTAESYEMRPNHLKYTHNWSPSGRRGIKGKRGGGRGEAAEGEGERRGGRTEGARGRKDI